MFNIISYSGGKDSTAMLIKMIEEEIEITEVIFIDLGKEFLEIELMIDKMKIFLKEKGIKFTKLTLDKDFDFYMFDHEKRNGKKGYGWCGGVARWGTSFKQQLFNKYIKNEYGYENVINYEGIAFDEPDRINKNKGAKIKKKYYLFENEITEKEALSICYESGFHFKGLYEHMDRVSCWLCQNNNLKELYFIWRYKPHMWKELKERNDKIVKLGNPSYRSKEQYSFENLEKRFDKKLLEELNYDQLCFFKKWR